MRVRHVRFEQFAWDFESPWVITEVGICHHGSHLWHGQRRIKMGHISHWAFATQVLQARWVHCIIASIPKGNILFFLALVTGARAYVIFACCSFLLFGEPAIVVESTTNTDSHKYSSEKDGSSLPRVSIPLLPIQKTNDLTSSCKLESDFTNQNKFSHQSFRWL